MRRRGDCGPAECSKHRAGDSAEDAEPEIPLRIDRRDEGVRSGGAFPPNANSLESAPSRRTRTAMSFILHERA